MDIDDMLARVGSRKLQEWAEIFALKAEDRQREVLDAKATTGARALKARRRRG